MKKEYIAPRAAAIRLAMEDTKLTGSKLSADGSDNIDITISDDTYDGTFRSNERGGRCELDGGINITDILPHWGAGF